MARTANYDHLRTAHLQLLDAYTLLAQATNFVRLGDTGDDITVRSLSLKSDTHKMITAIEARLAHDGEAVQP